MFKKLLANVRLTAPLIHSITNYVTANDCANMLLACGARPIMADDILEVEDITSISAGLNINLGTLNQRTIPAMTAAGKRANALGHPVVFDPVGAGASTFRTETARNLLRTIDFSVIRGNLSEIKTLANGFGSTKGVDADAADTITSKSLHELVAFAKGFAQKTDAVIAITGAIDIVANESRAFCVFNGHPMMRLVTGTGCQLSALVAAFAAANPGNPLEAAAAATCAMGICAETAFSRMSALDGNAAYRGYLIDAMHNLTPESLEKGAKYDVR